MWNKKLKKEISDKILYIFTSVLWVFIIVSSLAYDVQITEPAFWALVIFGLFATLLIYLLRKIYKKIILKEETKKQANQTSESPFSGYKSFKLQKTKLENYKKTLSYKNLTIKFSEKLIDSYWRAVLVEIPVILIYDVFFGLTFSWPHLLVRIVSVIGIYFKNRFVAIGYFAYFITVYLYPDLLNLYKYISIDGYPENNIFSRIIITIIIVVTFSSIFYPGILGVLKWHKLKKVKKQINLKGLDKLKLAKNFHKWIPIILIIGIYADYIGYYYFVIQAVIMWILAAAVIKYNKEKSSSSKTKKK